MSNVLSQEVNGEMKTKAAKKSIERDVSALQDDMDAIRSDIAALMKDAGSLADAKAREGLTKGKKFAEDATKEASATAKDAKSALESKIRKHPFAAVGAAVGAGVLLSLIGRK